MLVCFCCCRGFAAGKLEPWYKGAGADSEPAVGFNTAVTKFKEAIRSYTPEPAAAPTGDGPAAAAVVSTAAAPAGQVAVGAPAAEPVQQAEAAAAAAATGAEDSHPSPSEPVATVYPGSAPSGKAAGRSTACSSRWAACATPSCLGPCFAVPSWVHGSAA